NISSKCFSCPPHVWYDDSIHFIRGGSMTMELLKYDQAYHELIENYRLSENNLRFTIRPRNAVASKAPSRTHILVMEAGRLVTFFTLDYGEDAQRFAQHDHAILIRSFSTDIR